MSIPMAGESSKDHQRHMEWFTDLPHNHSVPAIEDPNTGITLWESGAIVEYLIATYDTSHKLSFASAPEKWQAVQFLHFQTSGQGPYFGQCAWCVSFLLPQEFTLTHIANRFWRFHPEQLDSAKERYKKEIDRVTMVLNECLQGKEYLVGNKCSYADLSFIPWYGMVDFILGDSKLDLKKDYPNYAAWIDRLLARPTVKKIMADKTKAMSG